MSFSSIRQRLDAASHGTFRHVRFIKSFAKKKPWLFRGTSILKDRRAFDETVKPLPCSFAPIYQFVRSPPDLPAAAFFQLKKIKDRASKTSIGEIKGHQGYAVTVGRDSEIGLVRDKRAEISNSHDFSKPGSACDGAAGN